MKAIWCILAIIILGLSSYPCSDNANHADETASFSVDHQHDSDEGDQCSPFCVCNCCSTQINQPNMIGLTSFEAPFADFNAKLTSAFIPSIGHSIWQPPKLG